jgi:hypothetical protein
MVRGIVMTGKSHHWDPMIRDSLPFSLVLMSKKTILKMACNMNWKVLSDYFQHRKIDKLTETKVPGRKNIVKAATLESLDSENARGKKYTDARYHG